MLGNRTHPPPRIPSRRQVSDHILQRDGFRGKGEIHQRILLLYFPVTPPFKDERDGTKKRGAHVALCPPNAPWRPWVHAPKNASGTPGGGQGTNGKRERREKRESTKAGGKQASGGGAED